MKKEELLKMVNQPGNKEQLLRAMIDEIYKRTLSRKKQK